MKPSSRRRETLRIREVEIPAVDVPPLAAPVIIPLAPPVIAPLLTLALPVAVFVLLLAALVVTLIASTSSTQFCRSQVKSTFSVVVVQFRD